MSETTENTLSAYLGPEFQLKLIWQLLVEPEFAERVIPDIAVEYFDDPNIKRLFLIMLEYIRAFEKVPNLQNQSINQAINQFKTPNNVIEEESLFAVVEKIKLWNERVLNKELQHDGDVVQTATYTFIKQQEYRKLGEFTITSTKNGEIRKKHTIATIEEKFQKIANIGDVEDHGIDVTENIANALRKEFRQTIPTGVDVIDQLTGGGLGRGEIGLILTPSGVGKTTLLTKIANTARELDYNVLQIIFEDTVEQIQRKHFTIWTGTPLSQIDDNLELVTAGTTKHIQGLGPGRLTIKKMSQEDTTMKDVKNWIIREQKKNGFKYDIVIIDYLDCLESHKKTADRNEAELVIVKSFEAMASDLNIPCWSAIQSNRTGFGAEFVEAQQTGGNIKRIQKAHFFMSVAKTPSQQEASLANIKILKARFAKDGQMFTDCIFNNDTMQIIIRDDRYTNKYAGMKKYGEAEIEKFENNNANLLHAAVSNAEAMTAADVDDALGNKTVGDFVPVTKTILVPIDTEDIFEIEGDVIEKTTEGLSEGVNEGATDITNIAPVVVSDAMKRGLVPTFNPMIREASNPIVDRHFDKPVDVPPFEWTGKTEVVQTTEIEVKLEDLPSGGQNLVEPVVLQPVEIAPIIEKTEVVLEKVDVKKAQEKLKINPDDPILSQKNMISYLMNKRSNEVINKKE